MHSYVGRGLELVRMKKRKIKGHSTRNFLQNGVAGVLPGKDEFLSRAIGSLPGRP